MAGVEDSTQGCRDLAAPDTVNDSTKPKKRKRMSLKKVKKAQRARVDIGLAFNSWRTLKATNGLKSDAEVAMYLLDK